MISKRSEDREKILHVSPFHALRMESLFHDFFLTHESLIGQTDQPLSLKKEGQRTLSVNLRMAMDRVESLSNDGLTLGVFK